MKFIVINVVYDIILAIVAPKIIRVYVFGMNRKGRDLKLTGMSTPLVK